MPPEKMCAWNRSLLPVDPGASGKCPCVSCSVAVARASYSPRLYSLVMAWPSWWYCRTFFLWQNSYVHHPSMR